MKTLGEIVDRICIVKLKNYYADTDAKKASTEEQLILLGKELDRYMAGAIAGTEEIEFVQNKVYKKVEVVVGDPTEEMTLGDLMIKLMEANHLMWLHQDRIYDINNLPDEAIRPLLRTSTALNVERNQFSDAINAKFARLLAERNRP